MISTFALSTLLLTAPLEARPLVVCIDPELTPIGMVQEDDRHRELYEGGLTFSQFLGEATRRKELWEGNYERGQALEQEVVRRVEALGGEWKLLAVAIDSCSDSVSTLPYIARLVELADNVDMRIVDPEVGRWVMEAHPTPDGRPSTPTVVLLNEAWEHVGCFIERPTSLQDWYLSNSEMDGSDRYQQKMEWYSEDGGKETIEEIVAILEAAASGNAICASSGNG